MLLFIRIENWHSQPKIDERQEKGESGCQVSSAAVLYKDFYLFHQKGERCDVSAIPHPWTYIMLCSHPRQVGDQEMWWFKEMASLTWTENL